MGFLNTIQFEYFNHFSTEFTAFTESISPGLLAEIATEKVKYCCNVQKSRN